MAVISDMKYDARVYKEAKSLVDDGHHVCIVSITPEPRAASYVQDGIEIVAIPYLFSKPKDFKGKLRKAYLNAIFFLRFFLQIIFTPAEVYHTHNTNTLLFSYIAAKLSKKTLIYDSHELFRDLFPARNYTLGWFKQLVEKWVEKTFITSAKAVITVSNSYANKLTEYYPINKPTVLHNCPYLTDRRNYELNLDQWGISDKDIVVLYQGGYYLDTRAIDRLVLAMKFLPDNYKLVMIGFAVRDEEEILRNLVDSNGLRDKVVFMPPVPHQELAKYTSVADVGTIPFYDNCLAMHLCTPNKVYEYLNAGIPVASTDLPEVKAIVDKYDVGEVFDPHSPNSIADAIMRITADRVELEQRKERSRAAAEAEYNWQVEEKKLIALYQQLAEG